MAQAAKPVARKGVTAQKAGGAKAAAAKSAGAKGAAEAEEDPEAAAAAAAAAAEAEAAMAIKQENLIDLKGRLTDTIHNLREVDKKSAEQTRLDWVEIGRMLNEGRALFTRMGEKGSNQTDEKSFGKWLVENGFDLLGQRPTRAGAAWLANVYDFKPGLYALFPTESVDGEPLRRSPRTLQAWVREQIQSAFQDAWEMDADGIEIAADLDGTKEQKKDAAKGAMGNVYDALAEQTELAAGSVTDAETKLKAAKTPNERKAASDNYMSVCGHRDRLAVRKDILDQHDESEMLTYFIGWRPKMQAVAFKDTAPDEAAQRLFALLKQHTQPGEVYDALGDLVDALLTKVAADGGEVSEGGEAEGGEAEGGDEDGFEVEEDGFEVEEDDFDPEIDGEDDGEYEEDASEAE